MEFILRTWFFNTNVSEIILRFCGCCWFSAKLKTLASFCLVNCLGCVSARRPGKCPSSLAIRKEFYLEVCQVAQLCTFPWEICLIQVSAKDLSWGVCIWRLCIKRACWTCQSCSNSESPHSLTAKKQVYLHWSQLLVLERIDLFFLCSTHDVEGDTQFLLGLKYEQKCSQNVSEKKEFWLKTSYKTSLGNLVLFSHTIQMFIFEAVLVLLVWKSLNSIICNIIIHTLKPFWQP